VILTSQTSPLWQGACEPGVISYIEDACEPGMISYIEDVLRTSWSSYSQFFLPRVCLLCKGRL